jgi:hypothetical protein
MAKKIISVLLLLINTISYGQNVNNYFEHLKKSGEEPIPFVQQKLEEYDLILFDDGLHSAYEPYVFYQDLINDPVTKLDYIFIEVFGIDLQPDIDAFLNKPTKDKNLLINVFQNDYTGLGWRYETYLDLLSAVWDFNNNKTVEKKMIQVIAVDQPIYWESIHNRKDYDIFLNSLSARDYFLYQQIIRKMENFDSGKKGIFLSNTRHIYKNIRNSKGFPYWECGTFFYKWHHGKTYAVRFHNVILYIENAESEKKGVSSQGLDNLKYKWVSSENGIWDKAFELNNNKPVAIPLKNNPFGNSRYIGNRMWNAEDGLTMYDAFDAIIFLAPIKELHFSAKMNFYYTPEFKKEIRRRIKIINDENLGAILKNNNAKSIDEYINIVIKYKPISKNEMLNE